MNSKKYGKVISDASGRAFIPALTPARLLTLSCAALLATAMTPTLSAQPAEPAIEEIMVISTTRRPEPLSNVNASISVLSEEELQLIAHTHIQEAANRLAGVNINRNNGQESLTAIRSPVLTGAGACGAFLLAEQGIPLRAAGFCNVNELFDAHTENAQRIEVIRGPGTAFYGSNAVHGMINVLLPRPQAGGEVTMEFGPRGSLRANSRIGFENDNFKHMFMINGTNEVGYRPDSGVDQQKLSWLYEHSTAGGLNLEGGFTATNLNQETAGYVEGTDSYKDDTLRIANPNPEAYRDNQSLRAWTRISKKLDSDWELVLTPYYRKADLNFIQHFLPGLPTEDNEHQSFGAQFAAYKTFSAQSMLALALDAESTEGSLLQQQRFPTVGSPALRAQTPVGKHYDYDVDATQLAPFAHYQHYWDNGIDISLGLRYERMEYDYDNNMLTGRAREDGTVCGFGGCRYNRPADRNDTFANWAPKLGIRYQFNDSHNVQARVNKGYRAPQATELYRLQNTQTVADLDAVEIDSYEIGFEGAQNNWQYGIVAYLMDKENEIITDSARINLNKSHTRHRGIELNGGVQLNDQWRLQGAYSYARHTYENDEFSGGININGNDVDTAPRRFGSFQLQWRPSDVLLTELEWVAMGPYYSNPENTSRYEGHDILNLRARWQASSNLALSLNLMNLTDKNYAERADYSFGRDRYFPGEPLRAFLAVNWKFN